MVSGLFRRTVPEPTYLVNSLALLYNSPQSPDDVAGSVVIYATAPNSLVYISVCFINVFCYEQAKRGELCSVASTAVLVIKALPIV